MGKQLFDVTKADAFDISHGLIDAKPAKQQLRSIICAQVGDAEVLSSKTCRLHALCKSSASDVVLVRSVDGVNFVAGQLWALATVPGIGDFALVRLWTLDDDSTVGDGHARWAKADAPYLLGLNELIISVTWCVVKPGIVRILIPFHLRGLKAVAR